MNQDAGMWWFQLHRFDPRRLVILRARAGVIFEAIRGHFWSSTRGHFWSSTIGDFWSRTIGDFWSKSRGQRTLCRYPCSTLAAAPPLITFHHEHLIIYTVNSELMWTVNSKHWTVNTEQWTVNSEPMNTSTNIYSEHWTGQHCPLFRNMFRGKVRNV